MEVAKAGVEAARLNYDSRKGLREKDIVSEYDLQTAAAFASPYTPVTTAIDIKSAYDNKNGAPSAGAPKVFFKYFYVNTATGEKSGEKMASAVLSA